MKVCKFGGTSLASAAQINKAVNIIRSDTERRAVVLSAPGKRDSKDIKVTDLLINCYLDRTKGEDYRASFDKIRIRFIELVKELNIDLNIETELDQILTQIEQGATRDYVESRGEYLCARAVAELIGAEFIDAADIIKLTADGRVDSNSYNLVNQRLEGVVNRYIIPGFYGTGPDGEIKSFSRGGSDITGAVVARGISADVYENWTDVSGILQADPRIVAKAQPIHEITYSEIRELASCGANVFHEEAIAPVRDVNIPINIRNTNHPGESGTMIVPSRLTEIQPVVGVSGGKPYRMLTIDKFMLNRYPELPHLIHDILAQLKLFVAFELKGFDSLAFIISSDAGFDEGMICRYIHEHAEIDNCQLGMEVALIGIIGAGLPDNTGLLGRMLDALEKNTIKVQSLSYGGSQLTALLVVRQDDYETALKTLVTQLQH